MAVNKIEVVKQEFKKEVCDRSGEVDHKACTTGALSASAFSSPKAYRLKRQ